MSRWLRAPWIGATMSAMANGKTPLTVSQEAQNDPATGTSARVLDALGDPTRRAIVDLLRGGPKPVGEIASHLPVSRPAVSQHLRTLKEAGVVGDEAVGTQRIYHVEPAAIAELERYARTFWSAAMTRFGRQAERTAERAPSERAAEREPDERPAEQGPDERGSPGPTGSERPYPLAGRER